MDDGKRALLRHTLATLAYRGAKALRGAPRDFAQFHPGQASRSAGEILAHIGDLLDWAVAMANGRPSWNDSQPLLWDAEVRRFFAGIARFDERLRQEAELGETCEKLFQGPVADALTHVGQLTMMRRLADAPIRGENYHRAEIVVGRVGPEQAAPRREFE